MAYVIKTELESTLQGPLRSLKKSEVTHLCVNSVNRHSQSFTAVHMLVTLGLCLFILSMKDINIQASSLLVQLEEPYFFCTFSKDLT